MHTFGRALLERLPAYFYTLKPLLERGKTAAVSSERIALMTGTDPTQVRKDLAALGIKGCPNVGYDLKLVLDAIRDVLGLDQTYRGVIVGAGHLGGALALYTGIDQRGLDIVGIYDNDPCKIGNYLGTVEVRPVSELVAGIQETNAQVGVLTVPSEAAQELADQLVIAGIRGIWCFASTRLRVPPTVSVRYETIALGLTELFYRLKEAET